MGSGGCADTLVVRQMHDVRSPSSPQDESACIPISSQAWRLDSGVWPGACRATESRAGHRANFSTAAAVAVGSYRLARLLLHRLPVYLRCLLPVGLLRRPRPGLLVVDTSSVWVAGRPGWHRVSLEHIEASSLPAPSSGLCDGGREPSLVRHILAVGNHRRPRHRSTCCNDHELPVREPFETTCWLRPSP